MLTLTPLSAFGTEAKQMTISTRSLYVVLFLGLCGPVSATTLVLQPDEAASKDTQIVNDPDQIFGSNPPWEGGEWTDLISNWQDNLRGIGLVQFDLSGIPAGQTILSATLALGQTFNSDPGQQFDVFRITSAWDEATVTFETAPTIDGVAAASMVIPDSGGLVMREWNVTGLTAGWVSGAFPNFGIWVEEIPVQGDGIAYFASSNFSDDTLWPRLTVEFVPEPGTGLLVIAGLLGLAGWRRVRA